MRLLQALSSERPSLLWVRLAGPRAGSGNKLDAARTLHLCSLIQSQMSAARAVIIEANARSQSWNMQSVQSLIAGMCVTDHSWCQYEQLQPNEGPRCNTVVRLATSFQLDGRSCQCKAGFRHVDSKRVSGDKEARWATVLEAIIKVSINELGLPSDDFSLEQRHGDQYRQPELSQTIQSQAWIVEPTPLMHKLAEGTMDPEAAEALARKLRLNHDFRCSTCYELLCMTPLGKRHQLRDISDTGEGDSFSFGAYAHGAFSGIIKATWQHPELVRYVNAFVAERDSNNRWSSLSINNNNPVRIHEDCHNLKGSMNLIICVGKYKGGSLWVETASDFQGGIKHYRQVGENKLAGHLHNCKETLLCFSPDLHHGPEPWTGDRWSINAYTSRGITSLSQSELDQLRSLKFPLGKTVPDTTAQIGNSKRVAFETSEAVSYPTEEAEKRKAKLKAGHVIKPRKFQVEQVQDDMGDDLSSILEHTEATPWTVVTAGYGGEHIESSEEYEADLLAFVVGKYRWMHGSSMSRPMSRLNKRGVFTMRQFLQTVLPETGPVVEVIEMFGGDANTSWILYKRHGIRTGWNFDLTVGIDLRNHEDIKMFWTYLKRNKPLVVIIAPPCRSYCSLANLNKVVNRASWSATYHNDKPLVMLSAEVAAFQMAHGRHFVAEQPAGSSMFSSREWQQHMSRFQVNQCIFDQCRVGLMDRTSGLPVKKPTRLVSSSPLIIAGFADLRCRCQTEHAAITTLAGSNNAVKSGPMQVWPAAMCDRLAAGIARCISAEFDAAHAYAADGAEPCPGCRWHKRRDHPSHNRSSKCKFPNDADAQWKCPACLANKPRADSKHTLDADCQWCNARTMSEGLSRERKGAHPRDVRVPASNEPTAALGPEPLRSVGSRESHPEDAEALRLRRASPASGSAPARRRDAEAQSSEGGAGAGRVRSAGTQSAEPEALGQAEVAPPVADAASAEPAEERQDPWTAFDLGRALMDLRSIREGVVRRALRKLHIRWFHASSQRMKTLLSAAGVPREVLALVHQIVDTCEICRNWARPGPRTVTSSSIPTKFNQVVQVDLLFYKDKVVLHMIDLTTRFTVAKAIALRNLDSVLTAIMSSWIAMFGPPSKLTSDQEGALASPEAAAYLESRGIKLHLLAKEQHAQTVERHHAILRRQLHVLDEQTLAEGLRISFDALLGEAVYAKNALFSMGGATPYEAVFGRTPSLFGVVDAEIGDSPDDRDSDRIRHLAIQSMIQATAENKLKRADKSKSRMPGDLLDLRVGDQVEFHRKATTKDVHSWFGPATVVDLTSVIDGQIGVKWQGRLLLCRTQDVRRAQLFWCFLAYMPAQSPVRYLCEAAVELRGDVVRLGWFRSGNSWVACEGNRRFSRVLLAGLHVGSCALNLSGVVSFRLGSSVHTLPAVVCDDSFLLWWKPGELDCWFHAYMPGNQYLNLDKITGLSNVAFVQYFCEDAETVAALRQVVHEVPNLCGPYEPSLPRLQDVTEEVARRRNRRQLAMEDRQAMADTDQADHTERYDIFTPDGTEGHASEDPDQSGGETEMSQMFSMFVCHPPEVCTEAAHEQAFVFTHQELECEPPQLAFSSISSRYLIFPVVKPEEGELLIFNYGDSEAVIERVHNILDRQEALANSDKCRASMLKELARWHKHKAWVVANRASCKNILSSKWVLKWKLISGAREIKARMVVQGFKDNQEVRNYAGTTSRWAQRLIIAISVQRDWDLYSADISEAFLRGLTFQELFDSGEDAVLREVQLDLPKGSAELLRTLPGMENFDEGTQCLAMIKPGFGLRDAPRLWNKALKRVLAEIGLSSIQTDQQLYVRHVSGSLVLILSVHVDDLKISGIAEEIKRALQILEKHFDQLKLEKDNFEHLGLKHTLNKDGSRTISQQHYVNELKPISDKDLKLQGPHEGVSETVHNQFRSLLGGVAWTVQTRPDIAVFVSALQRRMKAPRVVDILNLNRVLKYLKVKPLAMCYCKLEGPWCLVAVSDSSFKGEEQEHFAVRSGIIALASENGVIKGENQLQVLDFVSKKQGKVCRSTYAAELHSALDLVGLGMIINSALNEVLLGCMPPAKLVELQDTGQNALKLWLLIDAKSVWSSAIGEEAKCTDQTVYLHLLKLRQLLGTVINCLAWVDTRDMLSDALTKGVISRDLLRILAEHGTWTVQHGLEVHYPRKAIS